MKIDILYFEGCPHAKQALELVKKIVEELKVKTEINFKNVHNLEEAKKLNFYGSPSIQINGIDIEEGKDNRDILFGCRVYITEKGFSGLPPENLVKEKILEAREK